MKTESKQQSNILQFSKNDTLFMKGVAIIFLYCYHCFSSYSRLNGMPVSFFPLSDKTAIYICESLNMCVGMFAFLSIYGMTLTIKGKYSGLNMSTKEKVEFSIERYISLISGFLFPFVFGLAGCMLLKICPYGTGITERICNGLLDLFGVSMFFGTPMLTTTWWYVSLAVLFIFCMPLAVGFYKKYGILIIPMTAFFLLLLINKPDMVNNMNRWLFCIPLGICFADLELFQRITMWIRKDKKSCWIKRGIIYMIFVGLVYLRPTNWGLQHIKLIINSVIPVFMILILYDLFQKDFVIKKLLMKLGKHSGNMFYIHTFIRSVWFPKITYSLKYAVCILLFLLITTVVISMIMEKIKEIISWNSYVKKLKQRVKLILS